MVLRVKKLFSLALCIVLAVVFSGCARSDAKAAFCDMMDSFCTGSADEIEKYYNFEDISRFINEEDGNAVQDVILSTLTQMTYKVEGTDKIDKKAVKVTAKVTTIDFSSVMEKYITSITEMVAEPDYQKNISTMTPEQYQKILAGKMEEIINSGNSGTVEKNVSVTMVKENNQWKPGGDKEDIIGELFGDLTDAVNSLI